MMLSKDGKDLVITIVGEVGTGKTQVVEAIREGLKGKFYISEQLSRSKSEEIRLTPDRRKGNVLISYQDPQ
jgi:uridine kinase